MTDSQAKIKHSLCHLFCRQKFLNLTFRVDLWSHKAMWLRNGMSDFYKLGVKMSVILQRKRSWSGVFESVVILWRGASEVPLPHAFRLKETYHFFRATLTKILRIRVIFGLDTNELSNRNKEQPKEEEKKGFLYQEGEICNKITESSLSKITEMAHCTLHTNGSQHSMTIHSISMVDYVTYCLCGIPQRQAQEPRICERQHQTLFKGNWMVVKFP